jgi:hypothetical protein
MGKRAEEHRNVKWEDAYFGPKGESKKGHGNSPGTSTKAKMREGGGVTGE